MTGRIGEHLLLLCGSDLVEAPLRPGQSSCAFKVAILGRRLCDQRAYELPRSRSHLLYSLIESRFVGFGGTVEAAELSHELKSRGADFIIGRRRFKIEQGFDVTAHVASAA